jgi:hypothetical protein
MPRHVCPITRISGKAKPDRINTEQPWNTNHPWRTSSSLNHTPSAHPNLLKPDQYLVYTASIPSFYIQLYIFPPNSLALTLHPTIVAGRLTTHPPRPGLHQYQPGKENRNLQYVHNALLRNARPYRRRATPQGRKLHLAPTSRRNAFAARVAPLGLV